MKLRCEMALRGTCYETLCMHYEEHEDMYRLSCEDVTEYCDFYGEEVTCVGVASFS